MAFSYGPEDATPWHILKQGTGKEAFKRNIEDMSDDEDDESYIRNMQMHHQQRDENYRKFLIEESKRESTKWDDFSDTEYPEQAKKVKKAKTKPAEEETKIKIQEVRKKKEAKPVVEEVPEEKDPIESDVKPPKAPKFKAAKEPVKSRPKLLKKKKTKNTPKSIPEPAEEIPAKTLILPGIGNPALTCLGCRESGHRLKNCPKFRTSICIRCGQSDHKYQECPSKGGDFKFATCFVCKEVGHLSKQCPKNAHGVYPNGGACRYCNSTDHLAQDCRKKKRDNRRPGDRRDNNNKRKGNFKSNKFNKNFQHKKRKVE